MFSRNPLKLVRAVALLITAVATAQAENPGALIDALVKKGVLSSKEAEEIRAEMSKDAAPTAADKLKLSDSITEMKLYGDMRFRYQYDNKDLQLDPLPSGRDGDRSPSGTQRSRWRFRLRLNADFKLTENFYGGVELSTRLAADSANQTYEDGFNDYPIYISKAFLGWNPNDWLNVTLGKFGNPFYTTDLIWDSDITPNGLAETVAFHKMHFGGGGEAETGYSKDGKSVVSSKKSDRPWELTLVAGQFIFEDNLESAFDNDSSTDAFLFETQLIAAYKFSKSTKLTVAPAWMTYINGSLAGVDNNNPFNDNANVSGATRNLNILLLPGDLAFKIGEIKTKFYWDLAYNIEGRKRVEDIYNLITLRTPPAGEEPDPDRFDGKHTYTDNFAYLVGLQFGENKKKGDWSVLANWRQIGIGSIDPNLSDSNFAQGELNTRGFRFGAAYNFTDFCVGAVNYYYAWNLRDDLIGGEATGGNAIGDTNVLQVLHVDLSLKF